MLMLHPEAPDWPLNLVFDLEMVDTIKHRAMRGHTAGQIARACNGMFCNRLKKRLTADDILAMGHRNGIRIVE